MGGHKKSNKHKKSKKKRSKRRSSRSESSSEREWVEKDPGCVEQESPPPTSSQLKPDDWLSNSDELFATITRDKLKPKTHKKKEEKVSIDEMGQSSRELNPYWKDGGTGLPQEAHDRNKLSGTVGDLGLGWLRRALDRAKQTSIEENKSLEEVVAPVWGSLDKLLNLIKEAEDKAHNSSRRKDRNTSFNKYDKNNDHKNFSRHDRYDRDIPQKDDARPRSFKKPLEHDDDDNDKRDRSHCNRPRGFRKPSDDDKSSRDDGYRESSKSRYDDSNERFRKDYRDVRRSQWKKPSESTSSRSRIEDKGREVSGSPESRIQSQETRELPIPVPEIQEKPEILTKDEMNKLAADILRAEILGDEEKVKELKSRLDKAQAWLAGSSKSKSDGPREVILTETDSRGFTRPVASSSSQPHSKKRSKVETHKDGKRVRYFANDDQYSLQDLVHQEKFISVSDQNEMYATLSKGAGQKEDDDFEEGGGREKTEEWAEFSRRQRAALESTKREKVLDSCRFCLDSDASNRKLVISLMDKVYLSVPPYQSLTDGHCLIMPLQHTPCTTLLDEDVWEEVMDLRKLLVKMFLEEEQDVIFYESAKNINKFPHMILNCVPVPKETGDDAPIYFKKALLECETEWSNNKKVVDLKGKNIRKGVPKGLSYFWVDFGLQSGYAHVIEDERLFPRNFAEEVIGGMMDMDHSIWRKQKKDDVDVQIAKTQKFIRRFKEFTSKKQL